MVLDVIFAILVVFAIIRGYQRGLIVGIFSFLAVIIGLAAAIKLSAVVANHLGTTVKVSNQWLPVLSFVIVFIGVVLLIRLGANLIQKSVEWGMMGWVNRLGGILLYIAIYLVVYSVALFYVSKANLLQPATIEKSVTFPVIQPWGPRIIDGFGQLIPFFKDMFAQLESFFDGVAAQLK